MKFIAVAGARPNFMKIAPILDAFAARRESGQAAAVILVHTGQHYDKQMSDDFFQELGLPAPDINLGIGGGSHAEQTGKAMMGFEKACIDERPDCVIVVGDVNSTLACSITAKKLGIPVAHVEAGLRSRDMSMPEEINRLCTDAISDLLFTTDLLASQNLHTEGGPDERIHFVGNTMIDTLLRHVERARELPLPSGLVEKKYAVVTLHRPATVDSPKVLASVLSMIDDLSRELTVVFPVHPRTRKNLADFDLLRKLSANVLLLEPLSYLRFLGLTARSRFVLTDSGGIQEEATVLRIPCITMRANTERPITCSVGTNILAGTDPVRVRAAIQCVLEGNSKPGNVPEKWDGHSAERIVDVLLNQEFVPAR